MRIAFVGYMKVNTIYGAFPVPSNECTHQSLNECRPTGIQTPRSHTGAGQKQLKVPIVKKSSSHRWAINEQQNRAPQTPLLTKTSSPMKLL